MGGKDCLLFSQSQLSRSIGSRETTYEGFRVIENQCVAYTVIEAQIRGFLAKIYFVEIFYSNPDFFNLFILMITKKEVLERYILNLK